MTEKITGYDLSRNWFDFCFEHPEKVSPIHTAVYFFAIEHCNRLGWKNKFGFPSQMAMDAIGIKNWRTYSKALYDLIDFGFIELIQKSTNQYSSNIISIESAYVKNTKALDKAIQKHSQKQRKSIVSIDKQENKEQKNNIPTAEEFISFALEKKPDVNQEAVNFKYQAWKENGWKTGKEKKIINWKSTLLNTLKYLGDEKTRTNNRKGFESDTTKRAIESTIDRLTS